jgi:hypothetical protein
MAENERGPISLTDFLKEQTSANLVATVEAIPGDAERVKVTPWVPGPGCLCHLAFTVPQGDIASVRPTGQTHYCCGKNLKVVEITFKEGATMKTSEVFSQMMQAANERPHSHDAASAAMSMPLATAMSMTPDSATACVCPYTNGTCANLNDRGCDSMHQEWMCGTNGWFRSGRVCPHLTSASAHNAPAVAPAMSMTPGSNELGLLAQCQRPSHDWPVGTCLGLTCCGQNGYVYPYWKRHSYGWVCTNNCNL